MELSAGMEYDSNVSIEAIDANTSAGDYAALLDADFGYKAPLGKDTELSLSYGVSQSLHEKLTVFVAGRRSHNFFAVQHTHTDAGHRLLNYQGKCSSPHGHTFRAEVVSMQLEPLEREDSEKLARALLGETGGGIVIKRGAMLFQSTPLAFARGDFRPTGPR